MENYAACSVSCAAPSSCPFDRQRLAGEQTRGVIFTTIPLLIIADFKSSTPEARKP
jgi:hypothetical protein